jgi:tetrahydromethanopterin S-methyltransferase subunit G
MGTMTETGTEKRVDELSKRVDFGFAQVNRRLDAFERSAGERFGEANQRVFGVEDQIRELRSEIEAGFDSLHRLMIQCFAWALGSIIAGGAILFLSHS